MSEHITIERLQQYTEIVRELDELLRRKRNIELQIKGVSGVDYTRSKVTSSNRKQLSEEERYVLALEQVNKKIEEYKAWLVPEHTLIARQISRVKRWEYRKILVFRYLEKMKWSEIIADFFSYEEDFEDEKSGKYKDKVLYWNRQALCELDRVSSKPYMPVQRTFFGGLVREQEN